MKTVFGALLWACLTTLAFADENAIGFQSSTLQDSHTGRPLQMVVWYPTAATTTAQLIADNACKPGAQSLLEAQVPGDGIFCLDGDNGRAREVIQQQVTSLITAFLAQPAGRTTGSL
ncbi:MULTISPECIES: hypothetical protein [Pseudomonas]|uniref:hypothetical protein n=1 Tax=Pseudomonas TaxID=286 RepID=UPI0003C7C72D|nr:hypothetical protein O165_005275 [Pseudomonas soli]MCX5508324.1 hypothetical protein [Pseudomonas sp. BJa3]